MWLLAEIPRRARYGNPARQKRIHALGVLVPGGFDGVGKTLLGGVFAVFARQNIGGLSGLGPRKGGQNVVRLCEIHGAADSRNTRGLGP